MTQNILRKLMLIAVLLTSSHAFAYDFEVDGIYYNISGSEATVTYKDTNYNSYYGEIIIPKTINHNNLKYSVTRIDNQTFLGCTDLTSITIPNSVTNIGYEAFCGCERITSMTIPNSINYIGSRAFDNCYSLAKLIIEDGTNNLELMYNYYNTRYENGEGLFYDCPIKTLYVGRNLTYSTNYTYGYSPFYKIEELTTVTIGTSVDRIGYNAFMGCTKLSSIIIPNSVTSIGEYAFNGCSSLSHISIPDLVNCIERYTFAYCTSLTTIVVPENLKYISNKAFANCTNLTSVSIPNSVTTIYEYAFENCIGLTSLTIGNSVTEIERNAFRNCNNLKKIEVSQLNSTYDSRNNCNAVIETTKNTLIKGCKSTIIPNTVTSIGVSAFECCTELTSIMIPNSVATIGSYAFGYCTDLTEVICENASPATANYSTFYNVPTTATLYVPVGSKSAYANATGWSDFTNIIEDDVKTGVESTFADNSVNVSVENGNIVVNGTENVNIEVYNVNGQCIYNGTATTIPISAKGLYIVKVGNTTHKVIL